MPDCPHCQQPVDREAVSCPHCQATLKAYGHPGIPLHQATAGDYLCDRCLYHEDDSCNFPQRPYAKTCTLFRDANEPSELNSSRYQPGGITGLKLWFKRNLGILLLVSLILVSILIALN
ncbi:MAG: zinc ribbon domain-containing protein [Oscillatoria sp. PMC 1068.18]|nr:zinc ribbon domain-containing protein [Oscillatoria sp. PMC 1076.18]MEC4988593.1 zinc ribbon domain-containing protein [Oscillatoria sp. PMC 1068.18]